MTQSIQACNRPPTRPSETLGTFRNPSGDQHSRASPNRHFFHINPAYRLTAHHNTAQSKSPHKECHYLESSVSSHEKEICGLRYIQKNMGFYDPGLVNC